MTPPVSVSETASAPAPPASPTSTCPTSPALSAATASDVAVRPHLDRAARRRFLGLLLEPPRRGRQAALRALALEIPPGEALADLGPALRPSDDEVEAEHFRVLGAGGAVSACASDYVEGGFADKGPILADIAGFYRAFAFEPGAREAPDHFACMFEFLAFLALKQAYAALGSEPEQAEVAAAAERAFIAEHVAPYLARFAERLAAAARAGGAYEAIARVLAECGGA